MATAGTIAVNVVANTGGFASGMRGVSASLAKVQDQAGGLTSRIGGGIASLGKMGLAFAGIGSAAELASMAFHKYMDAFERIDQMRDAGLRMGATTQEVRQLGFAAEQSGTNLEAVSKGIDRMLRSIGEARGGNKQKADLFAGLGLDVDKLAGMSGAEAFGEVAEKLKNIENPADRAAVALNFFGKKSGELIPLIREGRDGLNEFATQFDRLGGVVTKEQADGVDEAADATNRLKTAWDGLFTVMAKGKSPFNSMKDLIADKLAILSADFDLFFNKDEWLANKRADAPFLTDPGENPLVKLAREAAEKKELLRIEKEREALLKQQMSAGAAIAAQNRTPLEAMAVKMAELNTLLDVGAIGWATYQRATAGATKELEDAIKRENEIKGPGKQNAGAVLKGSSAAFTAIAAARSESKRQEEIAKQSLAIEKKMEAALKSIDANTKSRIVIRPVGIGGA